MADTYTIIYFRTPSQGVNETGRGVAIFKGQVKIAEVSSARLRPHNLKLALQSTGLDRSDPNLRFEHEIVSAAWAHQDVTP